ncbi:MAG: beta-lactamase family protein [Bryobacteraceae bacterium]|nr:beta-lactamase family protein [Bryobacteraceae bacterium]
MLKLSVFLLVSISPASIALAQQASRESVITRAKSLELSSAYVPPPGDALEHHAAGYAKVMCSNVFLTGLDPDFVAENTGYFTAPYEERAKLAKPVVDRANRSVSVKLPNGKVRVAKVFGSQGCITLPAGRTELFFKPSIVMSALPPADSQSWPMGDRVSKANTSLDAAKLREATEAAFAPAGLTTAFLVVHQGQIVAERYADNITATTPLESWSMGKSLSATLLGIQIQRGVYRLDQPAPIPEWQKPGDPRAKIRIQDILQMSSGLRIRAPQDPGYDPSGPYPDHLYLYTGGVNSFHYAATRPQQWLPGAVGRYRNTDPVLTNYLTRLAVERSGENYHAYPQRALFDKIGIRTMVMETDPYGNFLTQGYEYASARDWVRLALLYLNGGVWNGERILPAEFVQFVQTLAPAWVADGRPIYGGLFWINGDGRFPAPRESYFMAGAGGQYVLIIPSRQLIIARLGHYKGSGPGEAALKKAIALVMSAVDGQ